METDDEEEVFAEFLLDHIDVIFKLYPYEFMVEEKFGEADNPITDDKAPCIPHSISDGPVGYTRRQIPDSQEIQAVLKLEKHVYIQDGDKVLEYIEQVVHGWD
ncbi:hypothetical protein CDD81_5345 [Ophiocordyceps australis]|uniref:Uncharacterized protein n=1 Tax=Ophiocordyceps australis TaxID=1399860 RepID=A0A2C5Y5C7_9HYPO|nr:hypothetical protein CDD81_5345 [Ophiocordyceps australis]